jgi:hypothetical protein
MPSTAVWGIPYAAAGDAPNGPLQEAGIANAVETGLNTVTSVAAGNNTSTLAVANAADVVVGGKLYTTAGNLVSTSAGTAVLANMDTGAINFIGGQLYEIEFAFNYVATVAGDTYLWQIQDTNLAGAGFAVGCNTCGSGIPEVIYRRAYYKPAANITKTFVGSVQRVAGTGALTVKASANGGYAVVKRCGAASLITNV